MSVIYLSVIATPLHTNKKAVYMWLFIKNLHRRGVAVALKITICTYFRVSGFIRGKAETYWKPEFNLLIHGLLLSIVAEVRPVTNAYF